MRKLSVALILLLAIGALVASMVTAQEEEKKEAEFEYVGAEKCAKMCHKAQYESWLETGHATTFADLSAEEQKKEECIVCHITGYLPDETMLTDVGCESCHGPGSEYKSPKIMSKSKWAKDPDGQLAMAMEAGLIMPTEEVCVQCHKEEGNPNFKPFNYEEAKTKVHPVAEE